MTSYARSTQRRDWTFTPESLAARREAALRSAMQARRLAALTTRRLRC